MVLPSCPESAWAPASHSLLLSFVAMAMHNPVWRTKRSFKSPCQRGKDGARRFAGTEAGAADDALPGDQENGRLQILQITWPSCGGELSDLARSTSGGGQGLKWMAKDRGPSARRMSSAAIPVCSG